MSPLRRLLAAAAATGLGAAGLVLVQPADAVDDPRCGRTNDSVRKILECVTLNGVIDHERAFQRIADDNDGTRASGTPGFNASLDYVEQKMERAGYQVTRQPFEFLAFFDLGGSALEQIAPTPTAYVEDTDFSVTPHSEPGDVTAPVTAVDLALGLGNASTSGCEEDDFDTFPAGNIALLQRGSCTFEVKAENAVAAEASGVIFLNQGDTADPGRQGIPAVTLGNGYTGDIPAISVTYNLGAQLASLTGLQMRLFANVSREEAITENLIAESKHGDPGNVVMAGAHLDSVFEGPGINDNGSGSSALLEVAEQLAKVRTTNRLRFAWWSAEEAGLVGSTYYVDQLSAEEVANHEMYLNFDMVGSPNYGLFALDGDASLPGSAAAPPGSGAIEALFKRYYVERGIPVRDAAFTGRSDYAEFIINGIPSGGLSTGSDGIKTAEQVGLWGGIAGEQYDQCYHQACDDIDNVSRKALRINADAMAYTIYLFATGKETISD